MTFYTFNGALPAPLPARIRLSNGFTRTNSSTYSKKEIAEWGYIGPIEKPAYNSSTEAIFWSEADLAYLVRQLVAEEIEANRLQDLRAVADYKAFYSSLLTSAVYQAIRSKAVESLALTVACTEFIAAISDAKFGAPNEEALQACINNIVNIAELNTTQLLALEELIILTGLSGLYTLPEINN